MQYSKSSKDSKLFCFRSKTEALVMLRLMLSHNNRIDNRFMELLFNSIQDYLYSIFYDTNRSKAVLQEIKFLQYILILTYDKIWLILYTV